MSFQALDEFLDSSITLPVAAKAYTFQSPAMEVGLFCQKVEMISLKRAAGEELSTEEISALNLDDQGEKDFYRMIMGATYDEMLADGVQWHRFRIVAATVLAWITGSMDDAEQMWKSFAPKAPEKATVDPPAPEKAADQSAQPDSTEATTPSRPKKTARATPGASS